MSVTERLALLVTVDGAGAIREIGTVGDAAERDLGKAQNSSAKMSAGFTRAGSIMIGAAAVIGAGLWSAGQSASELEQAVGGTEAVFKSSAGVIETWAKGADQAAGLSEEAARRLTTGLGGALQQLGFTQEEATQKSIDLTQAGADLAATFGGTTEEAVGALGSAFRGEFNPLERFNIFLKQSAVDARAVEMGLAKTTAQVDANARAQATMTMITEQSKDAQGQFGRELDTTAGKAAVSAAKMENAKAEIGAGFTPVMEAFTGVVSTAAGAFMDLNEATGGGLADLLSWGTVALGVGGAAAMLIGYLIKAKDAFMGFVATVRTGSLALSGTQAALLAVTGVLIAGAIVWTSYKAKQQEAKEMTDQYTEAVKKSTGAISDSIDEETRKIFAGSELGKILEETSADVGVFATAVRESGTRLDEWATYVEMGSSGLPILTRAIKEAADAGDPFAVKLMEMRDAGTLTDGQLFRMIPTLDQMNDSIDASSKAIEIETAMFDGNADAAAEAAGQTSNLAKETEEAEKEFKDAEKAVKDATAALKGWFDAQTSVLSSQIGAEEAIDKMTESWKENGRTMDKSTEKGRANWNQLIASKNEIIGYGMAVLESTESTEQATNAALWYAEGLTQTMRDAHIAEPEIKKYLTTLGLTPEQIRTQFNTPGLQESINKSKELKDKVDEIPKDPTIVATADTSQAVQEFRNLAEAIRGAQIGSKVSVSGQSGTWYGPGFSPDRKASGGSMLEGWTWTGEEGPELVHKSGPNVEVFSASRSAQMMAAASGGGSRVEVSIGVIQANDAAGGRMAADEIVRVLREYERSNS